jgi:hypothetical protein
LLYRADPDEHARIFGAPDREDRPGGYRKCRTCGGWHPRGRVPHNCRPPAPPRNPDLATPQLAPTFTPFRTGLTDNAEVIGDRRAKRNYMEKHDLAEYDEGVTKPDEHWTAQKEEEREIAELISTISQTDTDYLSDRAGFDVTNPERVGDDSSLSDGGEVDMGGVEVIK